MKRCSVKVIIALVVGLLSFQSQSAGPIMHVVLGERWLSLYCPDCTQEEKKLFLLGTVFPDIRYLGVIKREQTHFKGVNLARVQKEPNYFKRGMLFHSFVDEYRDKYVRRSKIGKRVALIPDVQRDTFLKLVEDQILHGKSDWDQFRLFLASIPEDEKSFGIPSTALVQWHTGLTVYFSTVPSMILAQIGIFDKGILMLDASTVKNWGTLVLRYSADPELQKYVEEMMLAFENELISYSNKNPGIYTGS